MTFSSISHARYNFQCLIKAKSQITIEFLYRLKKKKVFNDFPQNFEFKISYIAEHSKLVHQRWKSHIVYGMFLWFFSTFTCFWSICDPWKLKKFGTCIRLAKNQKLTFCMGLGIIQELHSTLEHKQCSGWSCSDMHKMVIALITSDEVHLVICDSVQQEVGHAGSNAWF